MKTLLTSLAMALAAFAASGQEIVLEPIALTVPKPVSITNAGDSRLFITQQSGTIAIFDPGRSVPAPFLDLRSLVSCCNERGLLGLAFHPRYRENGFFFVDYTDTRGDTVVARYRVSGDPDRADAGSAKIILTVAQPFANHNGGQLQFGPDGYLYIGLGDGGSAGDPANRAQDLGTLLGKLLRIDVDREEPYAIPPNNPFLGRAGARGEIWAYGLRNPWRFSFDRLTGDLWIGDVGQGSWEEVDLQRAGSAGGENYGWRQLEGTHCFNPSTNCTTAGMTMPVVEYDHSGGACSLTGGYRYRGTAASRIYGSYIYGDYCSGTIWALSEQPGGSWSPHEVLRTNIAITTFGEDAAGELYLASYDDGVIYRIRGTVISPQRRRAIRH